MAALRGSMEVRIRSAEAESGGQLIPGQVSPVEREQHSVIFLSLIYENWVSREEV